MNRILMGLALLATVTAAGAAPVADLLGQTAADYRAAARFPDHAWRLTDAVDPLLEEREPTVQSLGSSPRLSVWTSGIAFERGQSVDLHARLADTKADAGPLSQALAGLTGRSRAQAVRAEIRNAAGLTLAELSLADDGRGADRLAGDGLYSGRWTLPAALQPPPGRAESLLVRTTATLADGQERVAVGGFQYSHPGARLTGRYRDRLHEGSLRVEAEVEVLSPGRYHLAGTLADLGGLPLAHAQAAQPLAPGRHWLALDYYGLIFHELSSAGPFRLERITLTSATAMPNALGPVLTPGHRTRLYALGQFTDRPFGRVDLLEAARRLDGAR